MTTPPSRSTRFPSGASARRPTVSISAANTEPPPMASSAVDAVALRLARTMARIAQADASSMAPAASASVPSDEPARPRSRMMRASMGNAVIDIAAPMNNMPSALDTSGAKRSKRCPNTAARRPPSTKGAAMPAIDTATAERTRWRMRPISSSIPTRNMYSTSPTWATTNRVPIVSLGNAPSWSPGARSPKSDGPSSTPAIISPTTWGWPIRLAARPTTRTAPRISAS